MADRSPPWTATHVVLGKIGASWGIKGWVKLHSFTDPPENLLNYGRFWLSGPGGLEEIELDEARPHGGTLVAHIRGCDVREATGRYTGRELLVSKQELPLLADGYYWHQLTGLEVRNLAGEVLGRVDHLIETGANDVMIVRAGLKHSKEDGTGAQDVTADAVDVATDVDVAADGKDIKADKNSPRQVEGQTEEQTRERLLPWIEGQVIREVNLGQGYILVDWESDWD